MWAGLLLHFEALRGDGGVAPSPVGRVPVDVTPMPLGSKAAHDPHTGTETRMDEAELPRRDHKPI